MIARSDRSSPAIRFDNPNGAEIVGAVRQSRRFNLHCPAALLFEFYGFRNNSRSFAIFAAIRRALSTLIQT
jgi:hypothetical protein